MNAERQLQGGRSARARVLQALFERGGVLTGSQQKMSTAFGWSKSRMNAVLHDLKAAGLVRLSTATWDEPSYIQDYGSNYAAGTATHHLTLYRHASGALVFGAGSVQWSWGLDGYNAPAWHTPRASESAQRITRNVLDRMLKTETRAVQPSTGWLPSPIVLLASVAAIAFVARAWIWRRMRAT